MFDIWLIIWPSNGPNVNQLLPINFLFTCSITTFPHKQQNSNTMLCYENFHLSQILIYADENIPTYVLDPYTKN